MNRIVRIVAGVLLTVIIAVTISPAKLNADDALEEGQISVTFSNDDLKVSGEPGIDAGAAVVMEAKSGRVLYSRNPTAKRSIASTTKIMTAIITLENGNLSDNVEISERAASIWGSTIGLRKKQVYTMEELLYGMLLNSGNDAAVAIAEHIGGTVENFASMMNLKAKEIGAADSVFVTPHGLDTEGQYSTAYDLAIITRYALNNNNFSRIVATKSIQIPGHVFYNTNELLDIYPGTDGVKTGYTGKAGRCLVATAVRGDMRLISVVLGCSSRNKRAEGSRNILEYAFKNFKMYKLVDEGQEFGMLTVIKGKVSSVGIRAAETIVIPLSDYEHQKLEKKVSMPDNLNAPVYAGVEAGTVQILVDGIELTCTSLKTWNNVDRKGFVDYLGEIFTAWGRMMREGIFM